MKPVFAVVRMSLVFHISVAIYWKSSYRCVCCLLPSPFPHFLAYFLAIGLLSSCNSVYNGYLFILSIYKGYLRNIFSHYTGIPIYSSPVSKGYLGYIISHYTGIPVYSTHFSSF